MATEEKAVQESSSFDKKLWLLTGALGIIWIASIVIFGWYVILITLVSVLVSLAFDATFAYFKKQKLDKGWLLFPLVFSLMLPPSVPLWVAGVGAGFGNLFAKQLFGGYGRTIFHPSAVGIMFITISFPAIMFGWFDPSIVTGFNPFSEGSEALLIASTPLHQLNQGGVTSYAITDLLLGFVPGNIGETFGLLIILLGSLLIGLKVIDWKFPVSILVSYLLIALTFELFGATGGSIPSMFTGTLLFGSFFLATDEANAPKNLKAIIVYGFGIALITFVIRYFATFAEGFVFALIIMSSVGALAEGYFTSKEETA